MKYTKEHFWVRDDGGGIVALGITDYAQRQLGDIVFVDLPKAGTPIEQGRELGTVESVKSVSELFAPVTGQVLEVNPVLADSPELLNQEAESGAWLLKAKLAKPEELSELLDEAAYKAFVGPKAAS